MQEIDLARTSDIYMFNNMTLGCETEQVISKMKKNRGFKGSNFNGFKMRIECLMKDINGQFMNRQITEDVLVHRLLIGNADKPKDWYGPEPMCNSSELEMIYIDLEGAKLEKEHAGKKKNDVKLPFQALYTSIHVGEVVLSTNNQPFYVMIDNNFYGPFQTISIKPVEIMDNKHLYLPLMCYMPGSEI